MASILPLLFIVAVVYLFFRMFRGAKNKYANIPTFLEYKEDNPECIKDRKVSCLHCGGNNIFLKQVGKTPKTILNVHVCKTCGETLYRSSI